MKSSDFNSENYSYEFYEAKYINKKDSANETIKNF